MNSEVLIGVTWGVLMWVLCTIFYIAGQDIKERELVHWGVCKAPIVREVTSVEK